MGDTKDDVSRFEDSHPVPGVGETCPAAIELPGLRAPCPCAELAAAFGTRPPADACPARETAREARRRHERDLAAARAETYRALHEVAVAIRKAESRADALGQLAGPRRERHDDR